MKTALSSLRHLFYKAPMAKILSFVLISMFLLSMSPLSISGATDDAKQPSSYRTWLDGGLSDLANGTSALITGQKQWNQESSSETQSSTNSTYSYQGGAVQEIAKFTDFFYSNQPASFIVWAQDQYYLAQGAVSFSAAAAEVNPNDTSAYAPGTGYTILQPVLGLWQMSANIVYAVLMIILIIVAFLILLRQPLGGKEIVTLANSLPAIISTLVLVVFSYALCGLFIDAIYLGSNVSYNLLIGNQNAPGYGLIKEVDKVDVYGQPTGEKVQLKNILQPDDPQMSIWTVFKISGTSICNRAGDNINKCSFSYIIPNTWFNNPLGVAIEYMIKSLDIIGVDNALIELILALAIFQVSIKLFLGLLNSYLVLSFYPVAAPFVFLSGALPGGTMKALDSFFKTLGGAALNFIVIYACFLLLIVIGHTAVDSGSDLGSAYNKIGQVQWVPPMLGYSQKQIFDISTLNNNGKNIATSLLIFGFYMALPNVLEMIKKFVEVSSPFAQLAQTSKDVTKVGKDALGLVGAGVQKVMSGNFFG